MQQTLGAYEHKQAKSHGSSEMNSCLPFDKNRTWGEKILIQGHITLSQGSCLPGFFSLQHAIRAWKAFIFYLPPPQKSTIYCVCTRNAGSLLVKPLSTRLHLCPIAVLMFDRTEISVYCCRIHF